ncbi:chorismate lyase [Parashewanella curva]|uniref:Probable chorismate pyruvate-lyase n=1 Tax=Parashewanella curva TaxID=2338552 RepID=A0A3L8Q148_9GAMM|nr:chorismate lyase [Parashewanella curva]RLV60789.1 chorismate lyase [Parashewanella curva]
MSPTHSFPFGEPISWSEQPRLPKCTTNLTSWLLANGSLTEKLKACCQNFEVKVLGEALLLPFAEEMPQQSKVWVREVLLCLDEIPWVFARTLIPAPLLEQTQVDFKGLGTQPLGQLLYSHHQFIPGDIQVAESLPNGAISQLAQSLGQPCQHVWGRRRFFTYKNHQMTVSEFFLPHAVAQIEILEAVPN